MICSSVNYHLRSRIFHAFNMIYQSAKDWLKPHSQIFIKWEEFFSIGLSHYNQIQLNLSIHDVLICRPLDLNMVQPLKPTFSDV